MSVAWCVFAVRDGARCLLPVHPEHIRSVAVHSARLDCRYRRLVPVVHHRFHVLRMRQYLFSVSYVTSFVSGHKTIDRLLEIRTSEQLSGYNPTNS